MANGKTDASSLCRYRSELGMVVHVGRSESCFSVYPEPGSEPIGTIAMQYRKYIRVENGGRITQRWPFKLKDMVYGSKQVIAGIEKIASNYLAKQNRI